jgi:hypothetical protein
MKAFPSTVIYEWCQWCCTGQSARSIDLTGARLPLWRFWTRAKAPETREAAATAVAKADFILLFGATAV